MKYTYHVTRWLTTTFSRFRIISFKYDEGMKNAPKQSFTAISCVGVNAIFINVWHFKLNYTNDSYSLDSLSPFLSNVMNPAIVSKLFSIKFAQIIL